MYSTAPADWANTKLVAGVLLLYREAVSVFYCASRLGKHETRCWGLTPLQREAVTVFYCASRLGKTRNSFAGVLLLYREAVSVFYCPSRLGKHETRCWGLTPLQRSCHCILLRQPTGQTRNSLLGSYSSTEKLSLYSTAPADWEILHLCEHSFST